VDQFKLSPEPCTDGMFKGYERIDWIHSAALRDVDERFMNLMHHFNVNNLRAAFRQLDGSKAVGVDQITKRVYQNDLETNLFKLHDEIKRGGWRPKPSREILIPKPQGGFRPLAVGCLEDKIVQALTAKILEAIYEPVFHRHNFGFRTGKNTHQALSRLYKVVNQVAEKCVVVEMDIEKFFNSMDHSKLIELMEKRIGDSFFLRHIRRQLRNSILGEDGEVRGNAIGTPQGSPVSPILANIYLHYVLDEWFSENYSDHGELVRYADDAVFVFSSEDQAQQFQIALIKRMEEFGLKLNADKSGILKFDKCSPQGQLPFVGFCLYWGKNRLKQKTLKVKTAPKNLAKCIGAFCDWIKAIRCRKPLKKIWELAAAKLRGHFNYYGVYFNKGKLSHYYFACVRLLFKWLNRRSQKRSFTLEKFERRLLFNPLPKPPKQEELLDITNGLGTEKKHKTKSRMRKSRKYGSVRSRGTQVPLFT
jgi:RNA-directed DNA polymerase